MLVQLRYSLLVNNIGLKFKVKLRISVYSMRRVMIPYG